MALPLDFPEKLRKFMLEEQFLEQYKKSFQTLELPNPYYPNWEQSENKSAITFDFKVQEQSYFAVLYSRHYQPYWNCDGDIPSSNFSEEILFVFCKPDQIVLKVKFYFDSVKEEITSSKIEIVEAGPWQEVLLKVIK